jgi:Protein of function (DUF2518)
MFSTTDFARYFQWSGIATLIFAVFTIIAFVIKWGDRFRLVGATGFMGVLTGGLFALSLVPLVHTTIPGAVKYSLIYDNGNDRAVIAIAPTIKESELDATLRQAAVDLFSYGRAGQTNGKLNIRARTIIHPKLGISEPLLLGEVNRSLAALEDNSLDIQINKKNLAKLPKI